MTITEKSYPYKLQCFNPECRQDLGNIVSINGAEFLQIGSLIANEAHGICTNCGSKFHWSSKVEYFSKIYEMLTARDRRPHREE
jgi:hypothetical protein